MADAFGRRIARMLEDDGVGYALGSAMDAPTTLAIAEIDSEGAATYRFVFDGTSATLVTPEQAIAAVGEDCRVLHVGTLALVMEPLADATRAVVQAAGPERIVMVDPNCRPAVMAGSRVFESTLEAVMTRADVVKVSGTVLFTDGANSVEVICAGGKEVLPVPSVAVVDTVGAGDSFSGGFLAHWVRHAWGREELSDVDKVIAAAEFGITVAGITCQRAGADPPFTSEVS
ncbi:MAG: hypothetical protein EBY42_08640 [Actinobacteria bacterium]|nr:hypothetical protein [Actinomycetota bacterium]